jgi:hypothetical protein
MTLIKLLACNICSRGRAATVLSSFATESSRSDSMTYNHGTTLNPHCATFPIIAGECASSEMCAEHVALP